MPRLVALLLAIALPAAADQPLATILGYHEVDPAETRHAKIPRQSASADARSEQLRYTVFRDDFLEQLDYLEVNGYTVIPLKTLVAHLRGEIASLPPRSVVITVDDGWACTYSEMLPELRRRGMPFTVFVYPKFVGRGSHSLTWQQIEEMACEGVDVQSHSYTHPFLSRSRNAAMNDYEAFLRRELLESRTTIEKNAACDVRYFCYPFGDYDDGVAAAAERYGYEAALTTERGHITRTTPPMRLKRYLVHHDTALDEFKTYLVP